MKVNRIKEVLLEEGKTNNWLAKELNMNKITISRWCTNTFQPTIVNLLRIAKALDVDVREYLVKTK